ncbi:hypothetical protein VPH35_056519 [Triticum aestivum]
MEGSRWPDLPTDLLRDISGRLPDAADFFRFQAVCKPWRDSSTPGQSSPPWLLAVPHKDFVPLKFWSAFSNFCYDTPPSAARAEKRIWLSTADPRTIRYLTIEHLRPSIHGPLTGTVTHLPLLPLAFYVEAQWEDKSLHGGVYGDGAIFLYSAVSTFDGDGFSARFMAALLRLGDAEWTFVKRTLENLRRPGGFCAAYHGGRILFTVEASIWHDATPDSSDDVGDLLRRVPKPQMLLQDSYILESRRELLLASIQIKIMLHTNNNGSGGMARSHPHCMTVHALEKVGSAPEKTRWVRKHGRSLADRVLFLGSPNSFAVDASVLGDHNGGCAYFVYHSHDASPHEKYGVFRYNLIMNKVEFIKQLPQGWREKKCTWLVPWYAMAPTKELTEMSPETAGEC